MGTLDPQLKRWLTETGYYSTVTAVSKTGDPTYSAPIAFLCRPELDRWTHGPLFAPRHGQDAETMNLVFTTTEIPLDSIIWLPGESTASTATGRKPRRRETVRDENGDVSHYEYYL